MGHAQGSRPFAPRVPLPPPRSPHPWPAQAVPGAVGAPCHPGHNPGKRMLRVTRTGGRRPRTAHTGPTSPTSRLTVKLGWGTDRQTNRTDGGPGAEPHTCSHASCKDCLFDQRCCNNRVPEKGNEPTRSSHPSQKWTQADHRPQRKVQNPQTPKTTGEPQVTLGLGGDVSDPQQRPDPREQG